MVAKNIIDGVFALPLADQVELFEQLRERLRSEPSLSTLSDEDRSIIDERLKEFEQDPDEGLPWEQVESQIRASLRAK